MTNNEFLSVMFGPDALLRACWKAEPSDNWATHVYTASSDFTNWEYYSGYYSIASFKPNTTDRNYETFDAMHVLVLDDVGSKGNGVGLIPTAAIETSAGNFQHVFKLSEPCRDLSRCKRLAKRLAAYGDKSGNHAHRLARLPVGRNVKPDKFGFQNNLTAWNPTLTYTMEQLEAAFEVDTTAVLKPVTRNGGAVLFSTEDRTAIDAVLNDLRQRYTLPIGEGERDQHLGYFVNRFGDKGISADNAIAAILEHLDELFDTDDEFNENYIEYHGRSHYQSRESAIGCDTPQGRTEVLKSQFGGLTGAIAPPVSIAPVVTETAPETPKWMAIVDYMDAGLEFTKEHSTNAFTFLQNFYDSGKDIAVVSENIYRWNGRVWETVDDKKLTGELALAMWSSNVQDSVINGTMAMLLKLVTGMSGQRGYELGKWGDRDTSSIIVYQNGILDLKTNEFLAHTRDYFTTNIMPYNYDPSAQCPTWDTFVNEIFESDAERISLLEEWLGYMLVRDYRYQKAMMMIGQRRSGKGTIGKVLQLLVGDQNFSGASISDLNSDATLESLLTKTVAFDGDFHGISRYNTEALPKFKRITGNDPVSFNRKYKSGLDALLPTRFTMAVNNSYTGMIDDSGAALGRFLILVFNRSWFGKEDLTLIDRLYDEIEGIANRAISGLRRLNENRRFTESSVGERERSRMAGTMQPITLFVEDNAEITGDENHVVPLDAMWLAYKMWCTSVGYSAGNRNTFSNKLIDTYRGQVDKARKRVNEKQMTVFTGVTLITELPTA